MFGHRYFATRYFAQRYFPQSSGITPIPPDDIVGGGFGDHKKYRKYLERLNGITAKTKITPELIEAAEAITEIPVSAKQITKIAYEKSDVDFAKLAAELQAVQNYIDLMLAHSFEVQKMIREKDDEMALLLLI
jgi:hypothetical protein